MTARCARSAFRNVLSPNLTDCGQSHTSELTLLSREHDVELEGYPAILRLSVLADFYWYQVKDLVTNVQECRTKLQMIRAEARRYFLVQRDLQHKSRLKWTATCADPLAYIQGDMNKLSSLQDSRTFKALDTQATRSAPSMVQSHMDPRMTQVCSEVPSARVGVGSKSNHVCLACAHAEKLKEHQHTQELPFNLYMLHAQLGAVDIIPSEHFHKLA
ncbi:hypothetical protein CRENBAI_016616 [Crenichthys baileyi]|uniref:Uncharacterized protein n=1 Tax=Crenichthys baileyi TaxID=28760 RepID=A0AAV9S4J5_9TELE